MNKYIFCLIVLLLALCPYRGDANLDDLQSRLLEQFEQPLRWDNVEGGVLWVNGEKPDYNHDLGFHVVRLDPGEHVTVNVPSGEMARLFRPDEEFSDDDLDVSVSNGSGLYLFKPFRFSSDRKGIILSPQSEIPSLVRISRGVSHTEPIEIALFVSRKEVLGEIAPYRELLRLPGRSFRINRSGRDVEKSYWLIQPHQPLSLKTEGVQRLVIESRFSYPVSESRRQQSYRIYVRVNGRPFQTLEFETKPEIDIISVNMRPEVLGRQESGYIELPEGRHTIQFETTAPLYIRLLKQEETAYLFQGANEPDITAEDIREEGFKSILRKSSWDISDREVRGTAYVRDSSASEIERIASHLFRDNSRREGPISGVMLLKQKGLERTDYKNVRMQAEEDFFSHTFYRDLMPTNKPGNISQEFSWFFTPSLKEPHKPDTPHVSDQHLDDALRTLSSSLFIPLPSSEDSEPVMQRYSLPKRSSPTILRVVVDRETASEGQELMIQLDSMEPVRLQVLPEENLKAGHYLTTAAEEALRIIKEKDMPLNYVTLSGPFSARQSPARLIKAGFAEIYLPAEVKEIKLWSLNSTADYVRVAIQYRASRPYQLSESEFMDALNRVDSPFNILISSLRSSSEGLLLHNPSLSLHETLDSDGYARYVYTARANEDLIEILKKELRVSEDLIYGKYLDIFREFNPEIQEEMKFDAGQKMVLPLPLLEMDAMSEIDLFNHLLPLSRFLRSREKTFLSSITSPGESETKGPILSQHEISDLAGDAKKAEEEEEWLEALKKWTDIVNGTSGSEKQRAEFARITVLEQLGEEFLAENLLRGIFFYSDKYELREDALAKLADFYRKRDNGEGLLSLFAVAAIHYPDNERLTVLTETLVKESYYELALTLGLFIPESRQPLQAMLRASFNIGWWRVFEKLSGRLEDEEERHFWTGQRLQKEGNYSEALHHFSQAGTKGGKWVSAIREAVSISKDLRAGDAERYQSVLLRWQRWQAHNPSPYIWQKAPYVVKDYAGAANLYNRARDMYSHAFISEGERPVKLSLMGPAVLRIEARPLHKSSDPEPIDGWLEVREASDVRVFPINSNTPSQLLAISGNEGLIPGRKVTAEYSVGPGLHEIEVSAEETSLIVQIYIKSPEIRIGLLPPMTPDTLIAHQRYRCNETILKSLLSVSEHGGSAEDSYSIFRESERKQAGFSYRNLQVTPSLPAGASDHEVLKKMVKLLWLAEKNPGQYKRALAEAERLSIEYSYVSGLRPMLNRIFRGTTLAPLRNINSSAGIRLIESVGWNPFSLNSQVRKALLEPVSPDEHILYGHDHEIIHMTNLETIEISAEIKTEGVAYLPLLPMTGYFQLDDEKVDNINLTADAGQQALLHFSIPPGEHYLRIGIRKPVPNQFLRMNISETGGERWGRSIEHQYYIATREEPVVINLEGPAVLYMEKLRKGRKVTDYRMVEAGWQKISIYPEDGEQEALFRFYLREVLKDAPSESARRFTAMHEPVSAPTVKPAEPRHLKSMILNNDLSLGGQEDGTWTLSGELVKRRNVNEDRDRHGETENFLEIRAAHRQFNKFGRRLLRTELLTRIRENGGPVIGLKEHINFRPLPTTLNFQLDAGLFMQRPGCSGREETEWSAQLKAGAVQRHQLGPKSYHTPSLFGFIRRMSMDNYCNYSIKNVDQDIFTPYKSDHRYGLILSETLVLQPWLDTNWFAGASLVSNEDANLFKPDHITLKAGWKQLIREFQVNAEYRRNHYFSDDDREGSADRERIELEVFWNRWRDPGKRLELGLNLIHELDTGRNSGMIFIRWHTSNGRRYHDFNYGEVDFPVIRNLHLPHERNNPIINAE